MATFTEQLMSAKRQARLQGRPVSQQEAAGISQGVAATAADRTLAAEKLNLERTSQEKQAKQFAEQLAMQKDQYARTLSQQKLQFGQQIGLEKEKLETTKGQFTEQLATQKAQFEKDWMLKETALKDQILSSERMYKQAVDTLAEQTRQYNESSAAQKEQFGAQMKLQMEETQRKIKEFEVNYRLLQDKYAQEKKQWQDSWELEKSKYISELIAAGQPIPASMAPEGWSASRYLELNPDVAENPYWSSRPLEHWYLAGKGEGRSYT